jgi:ribonuclease P protein component
MQQRPRTNAWFAVHSVVNSAEHARLGISVSKRVIPTAVGRNFVKRLIRDCFRNCAQHSANRDVVVRLRKPLEKKDISIARLALNETLKMVLAEK